jgi:hypothetical protein
MEDNCSYYGPEIYENQIELFHKKKADQLLTDPLNFFKFNFV